MAESWPKVVCKAAGGVLIWGSVEDPGEGTRNAYQYGFREPVVRSRIGCLCAQSRPGGTERI